MGCYRFRRMPWIENRFDEGIVVTRLDSVIDWVRGRRVSPITLSLGCCAVEAQAAGAGRRDLAGLVPGLGPSDPDQSNLMIVAGTVNAKMAERIRQFYEQMRTPRYVIAMGGCAIAGGPYSRFGYNVIDGIDRIIPVDVYIPGCPPRPEALLEGIARLREKIRGGPQVRSLHTPGHGTSIRAENPPRSG